jgi:hypothetical protein
MNLGAALYNGAASRTFAVKIAVKQTRRPSRKPAQSSVSPIVLRFFLVSREGLEPSTN